MPKKKPQKPEHEQRQEANEKKAVKSNEKHAARAEDFAARWEERQQHRVTPRVVLEET